MERGEMIPISIEVDDKGYLDRKCPSPDCNLSFKVHIEDWKSIVSDEGVFCPRCRYESPATEWNTVEQIEQIRREAVNYARKRIGNALQADARSFNSRQNRRDFVHINLSYRPAPNFVLLPAKATEIMTQGYECRECSCRYASIGVAFFCPACGWNSIFETFGNAIDTVEKTIEALPTLRQALADTSGKDVAEDISRQTLENALVKTVSSFQKYAESCYLRLITAVTTGSAKICFRG